jgi:hypothetical protein
VVEDGAQELARVSVWVGLWAFVLEENHAARLGSARHRILCLLLFLKRFKRIF